MPIPLQLYNIFRSRWCGAYLQENGINVIPTVYWGEPKSFDFCFAGLEIGTIVAVSTLGVRTEKDFFMRGYNEMMRRIKPSTIICYSEPFEEMQGNIITIDYAGTNNLSNITNSKNYFNFKKELKNLTKSVRIVKTGYVLNQCEELSTLKGAGSASGGRSGWRPSPNKPEDGRYLGKPGEVKETIIETRKGTYKVSTKIGNNGKAIMERHWTNHNRPWLHSDPHDHPIDWSNGCPQQQRQINYVDGKAPEFKAFKGGVEIYMKEPENYTFVQQNTPEQNRFVSIDDFKDCMNRGGEVNFEWNDKEYWITHPNKIAIYEPEKPENDKLYSTIEELLDHEIDGEPLRKIVTKLKVWFRTI